MQQKRIPVYLRVYDISNGKAAVWSQLVLRKRIEGIWHTGIHVFGFEYFYGGGINCMTSSQVESSYDMDIVETRLLGYTMRTRCEFEGYLLHLCDKFTPDTYDLAKWNCNHFSDTCARFLLDNHGIPDDILNLPDTVASSFLGSMALKVFQRVTQGNGPPTFSPDDPTHPRHEFFPEDMHTLTPSGTSNTKVPCCTVTNFSDSESSDWENEEGKPKRQISADSVTTTTVPLDGGESAQNLIEEMAYLGLQQFSTGKGPPLKLNGSYDNEAWRKQYEAQLREHRKPTAVSDEEFNYTDGNYGERSGRSLDKDKRSPRRSRSCSEKDVKSFVEASKDVSMVSQMRNTLTAALGIKTGDNEGVDYTRYFISDIHKKALKQHMRKFTTVAERAAKALPTSRLVFPKMLSNLQLLNNPTSMETPPAQPFNHGVRKKGEPPIDVISTVHRTKKDAPYEDATAKLHHGVPLPKDATTMHPKTRSPFNNALRNPHNDAMDPVRAPTETRPFKGLNKTHASCTQQNQQLNQQNQQLNQFNQQLNQLNQHLNQQLQPSDPCMNKQRLAPNTTNSMDANTAFQMLNCASTQGPRQSPLVKSMLSPRRVNKPEQQPNAPTKPRNHADVKHALDPKTQRSKPPIPTDFNPSTPFKKDDTSLPKKQTTNNIITNVASQCSLNAMKTTPPKECRDMPHAKMNTAQLMEPKPKPTLRKNNATLATDISGPTKSKTPAPKPQTQQKQTTGQTVTRNGKVANPPSVQSGGLANEGPSTQSKLLKDVFKAPTDFGAFAKDMVACPECGTVSKTSDLMCRRCGFDLMLVSPPPVTATH